MEREKLIKLLSKEILAEFEKYNMKPLIHPAKNVDKKSKKELKNEFENNKVIPKGFEPHILYALSFYPELKDVKISFQIKQALFLMETRIKPLSFFSGERHYIINIKKSHANFLLANFSIKGLAGLICHELSHVLDYKRKSRLELLGFALKYIFSQSRRKIELMNDLRTFYHGTVESMILYEDEYYSSGIKESFKKYRTSFYLTRDELRKLEKKNLLT